MFLFVARGIVLKILQQKKGRKLICIENLKSLERMFCLVLVVSGLWFVAHWTYVGGNGLWVCV